MGQRAPDVSPPCSRAVNSMPQVEIGADVDERDTTGICETCRPTRRADATPLAIKLASGVVATLNDSTVSRLSLAGESLRSLGFQRNSFRWGRRLGGLLRDLQPIKAISQLGQVGVLGSEGGGLVEDQSRSGVVGLVEQQLPSPAAEFGDLGRGLLSGRQAFEQPADAILPQELHVPR